MHGFLRGRLGQVVQFGVFPDADHLAQGAILGVFRGSLVFKQVFQPDAAVNASNVVMSSMLMDGRIVRGMVSLSDSAMVTSFLSITV